MSDQPQIPDLTSEVPAEPADADTTVTDEQLVVAAPEVMADSTGDYFRAWGQRIKSGESGALPVLIGLIALVIFFELENGSFLHASNLVNLFQQASIFVMFGAAEIFVLLLSEIDLSIGFGAGVGAMTFAALNATPVAFPWWLALIGALAVMCFIGFVMGSLISRLGIPSFIVTLGGYLAFQGVMIEIATIDKTAVGGVLNINPSNPIGKLATTDMSPVLSWTVMIIGVLGFAAVTLYGQRSRLAQGLTAPPMGVILMRIIGVAIGGIAVVVICSFNQGVAFKVIRGVPWVVPFIVVVLVIYHVFLSKTRTGRYIYAVGNSPEAARRAGINVKRILTLGFILSSFTAGLAGLIYASNVGSISIGMDGGQYVLYAVAAAVIGGTSLFGGRGRIVNALIGGMVIAVVYNGLAIMSVSSQIEDIVVAVILIAAVSLDAAVRKRSATLVR